MYPLLLSAALLAPAQPPKVDANDVGVLPLGADGKPLNLDFETGDLKDWTATGDAFKGQPIKGDTVKTRRGDMQSRHQGQFWIGGYEKVQDKPTGTLTSVPFKVTHAWASFLVGGGPHPLETCVEIVMGKDVIFRASGTEEEDMHRAVVDLTKYKDKEIFIRVVDKHTGHWGHINFDDFRFHEKKPNFPQRLAPAVVGPVDEYKFAGLKPEEAAKAMTVPDGFSVSVFAGEPDVHQPIAFCIDHRGRLWVVEAYTYPRRNPEKGPIIPANPERERRGLPREGDRIIIFEDTDGDGKFDKRTVFMEGLNLVSGIEVGFGGVWIGAAPYFLFIPHDEKTDKPAGEPKILLDGWGYQDTHETLNSFIWGPDGWLYGCHGVFTHSRVGKPGTPDAERTPINAGIWRYHPTKHTFEVFCHGTSNPWGLDYNANGDFFIEACVIPHMWHMIQGARYHRQGGVHFNPYTYDDIKTIANHRHYVGATPHSGNGRSDSVGGGHAHAGLLCYQGGAWPKEYNGKLFMGNLHGHRINVDVITQKGSGYVADRNPDFLLTNDKWAIPLALRSGPDGNVYLLDWYDKQICHTTNEIWDRTNGRIYKISHKDAKPVKNLDLSKATWAELVKYQEHENDWYARMARRMMQERVSRDPKGSAEAVAALAKMASGHKDETVRLRALWALHTCRLLPIDLIAKLMFDKSVSVQIRSWILTAHSEGVADKSYETVPCGTSFFMGLKWENAVVKRHVMSDLLRTTTGDEDWRFFRKLYLSMIMAAEDATDHNLPYMYWYALEPVCEKEPAEALKIAAKGEIPFVFQCAARRVGAIGTPEAFDLLTKSLAEAKTDAERVVYFRGLQEGARGKRTLPMPKDWTAAFELLMKSPDAALRQQALGLAAVFGDKSALGILRKVLADSKADVAARLAALTALVDAKDAQTAPLLQAALADKELRSAALRGLAAFDDAKTPAAILAQYATFTLAEKRDALATLAARVGFAKGLMNAVAAKTIPATDVPAEIVRQLRGYEDATLDKQIADLWGVVRESPAEKKQLIAGWKKRLTAPMAPAGDVNLGRAVFAKTCLNCHTLYAVGGKVGPEITGANRGNLDYLLENILDPSAVIPKEYAATRIVTTDDRNITGIVKSEVNGVLTIQTEREVLTLAVKDIASRKPSELSMMPDDLLKQVNEFEFRSLIAYLQTPGQVPLLANAENAKEFFNGKDLTNWDGDKELWKAENGEIVGKTTTGLKRNNFLVSHTTVENFKLSLKVKLTPNKENSGVQFRSVPLADGEMRGPQADIGAGWWGKLYEESGRGLLTKDGGEKFVKPDEWNDYVVEAVGGHVKIWINGNLCTDYEDDKLSRRGVIGFQIHSGGPMEVRFKDIKLEVLK